jgi:hypothetical protein
MRSRNSGWRSRQGQKELTQERTVALQQWLAQQQLLAQQQGWSNQQFAAQLQTLAQRPATPWINAGAAVVIMVVIILAIDVFAMPMLYVPINVAIVIALTLFTIATRKSYRSEGRWAKARGFFRIGAVVVAILLIVVPLVSWIALSGVWLPKERVLIGNKYTAPVYVLSDSERWTNYMDDDATVHVVATPEVKCRGMVGSSHSFWQRTVADLVVGPDDDQPPPVTCPPLQSR